MANKIIFFTGSGISKESGIPTFQEMAGVQKLRRCYAARHPKEFRQTILDFKDMIKDSQPNAAHKAIAELGCPVITMNVDGLHQKAGSKEVVAIHGDLPTEKELRSFIYPYISRGKPTLYEDFAPRYYKAIHMVRSLTEGDYFIMVGTSFYTGISNKLKQMAEARKVTVILVNDNACQYIPGICRQLKEKIS